MGFEPVSNGGSQTFLGASNGVDDTTAVQAALALGGTIAGTEGVTYIVANLDVAVVGTRLQSASFQLKTAAANHSGSAQPTILWISAANVSVEGCVFDQQNETNSVAVELATTVTNARVTGCRFTNTFAAGVHLSGACSGIEIDGNRFSGNGYGVLTADAATCSNVAIVGNVFTGGTGGDAIEINTPTSGSSDYLIADNTIDGYPGTSQNSGFGIAIARVVGATVSGNRISNCGRNGIHVEDISNDVTITGNTVHDCNDGGIEVQPGTGKNVLGLSIVGNTVYNCCKSPTVSPTGLGLGGIQVGWNNGATGFVYGATITGNASRFNQSGAAGIYLYQCQDSTVTGNVCVNNAGAGLDVTTFHRSMAVGNRCFDNQTPKTQTYGFKAGGGGDGAFIGFNSFEGNLTGEISSVWDATSTFVKVGSSTGLKPGLQINDAAARKVGFFGALPVIQQAGTGTATGFTAGAGTAVTDQSTFTGAVGTTAYRISDVVKALKNLGFLAS